MVEIELFRYLTLPELSGEMCTAWLFSHRGRLLNCTLKFYLDRVVPIYHSWRQKTQDPMVKTASLCVCSFWHNIGVC